MRCISFSILPDYLCHGLTLTAKNRTSINDVINVDDDDNNIMGKGQLLFKGDKVRKKKKNSKHSVGNNNDGAAVEDAAVPENLSNSQVEISQTPTAALASASAPTPTPTPPSMKTGTGTITTSGTVVTGHETRFEKELSAGDAIMCVLGNGQEELRVITMRLSNASLNLSSAFSSDLKNPTSFQYIRKPRDVQKERAEANKRHAETLQEQKTHAFDLYGNESLVYREKTETGSYRIKREQLNRGGSRSRGDLLEMRAKKTSDKYC